MTEPTRGPCWLYHARLGAKIFMTQAELVEAHAQGWRDSPGAAAALALAAVALPVIEPAAAVKIEHPPLDLPGNDAESAPDDGVIEHSATELAVIAGANALGALLKEDAPAQTVVAKKKRKRKTG